MNSARSITVEDGKYYTYQVDMRKIRYYLRNDSTLLSFAKIGDYIPGCGRLKTVILNNIIYITA